MSPKTPFEELRDRVLDLARARQEMAEWEEDRAVAVVVLDGRSPDRWLEWARDERETARRLLEIVDHVDRGYQRVDLLRVRVPGLPDEEAFLLRGPR